MAGKLDFFLVVVMVQLFWSFGVTTLAYVLPTDQLTYSDMFVTDSTAGSLNTFGQKVQASTQNQMTIPAADVATLIFYSGNLIIDLILNFVTAFGQMFNLILHGVFLFIPINATVFTQLQLFIMVLAGVLYVVGFVNTLIGLRSGSAAI